MWWVGVGVCIACVCTFMCTGVFALFVHLVCVLCVYGCSVYLCLGECATLDVRVAGLSSKYVNIQ